jgi:hypothetical protein
MKKIIIFLFLCTSLKANAQLLFIDSFLYTPSILGGNGSWVQSSPLTTGATLAVGNGLIYPNYSNALSGAAEIFTNGNPGDLTYAPLSSAVTSNTVYASFVINITTAPTGTSNTYCIALGDQTGFAYGVRLLVKASTAGFVKLGTRKAGGSDVWSTIDYPINNAHLVILKYKFNGTTTSDDECKMYVNPINTNAEPAVAQADASMGADFTSTFKHFIIRNNGGANIPSAIIDEVHVGITWDDIFKPVVIVPQSVNNNLLNEVTIFPNPTNGMLNLNNVPKAINKFVVIDQMGKQIFNTKASNTLDISNLPMGTYFLHLSSPNSVYGYLRFEKK